MAPINTISQSVKYGLHYAASWPDASFLILRKFLWMILFSVLHWHQYSYVIAHFRSDTLMEIIDNLGTCLAFTLMGVKLVIAWAHHSLLRKILITMDEECKKYAVMDTNNLISKTAHLSFCLTTGIMSLYVISTIFYAIDVLMPKETNITTSRKLLLKMDLPFDASRWPIYNLVITVQYFFQASSAFMLSVFTALLLMVVLHVGCQIDIMCQTLTNTRYEKEEQLKFFISRHQDIIIFSEQIEQFFTYTALIQLLTCTIITCCLGYLIIIELNTTNESSMLTKCVVFYISISFEGLIYSFAGEYLSDKSKLIGNTAYEFLWYNLHPNESRLLIPVILRSQRGFTFTCGKFSSLSMETFTSMMKASASYISVLLAMT
ncbi:PREDICTED: odorant receptor 13a-like [Eufriesea mexicana]|uniref:odorant receptor 13a-like n=1 Tax=Eufriesea mexicana TaxID=516756 RepID=UPI00083BAAAF|nr:PREDICTED: odorant receptor 13a-like [Eufriesea mexicana]